LVSVIIPFHIKKRYWGLIKMAEGLGGITAICKVRYNEYK